MDKTFFIEVGQVVRSKSGRDSGKIFLVYKIIDEDYVLIVDGKSRKLDKPKKKKIKHLITYNDKIKLNVENFNDSYIRRSLSVFN